MVFIFLFWWMFFFRQNDRKTYSFFIYLVTSAMYLGGRMTNRSALFLDRKTGEHVLLWIFLVCELNKNEEMCDFLWG